MLNQGKIYTNEKCIGCNRCIYECPVLGANVSRIENGQNRIYVDPEKCIHCGKCLSVCRHEARQYRDDTVDFIDALKSGKKISIIVSPVLYNNYNDSYKNILGYLQALGAHRLYDSAIGADIVTWAYIRNMRENQRKGMVISTCPAIVNYVLKYKSELCNHLFPYYSPVPTMAIYAKKYLHDDSESFAYIGPCIEAEDDSSKQSNNNLIEYNITIKKLLEALEGVDLSSYSCDFQKAMTLGMTYCTSGGASENIHHFQGYECMLRTIDGQDNAYNFVNEYAERIKCNKQLPDMVDLVNCNHGCLLGTGVEVDEDKNEDVVLSLYEAKKDVLSVYDDGENPFSKVVSRNDRIVRLYKKYENIDLNDFVRNFENVEVMHGTDDYDEDEIFNSMYKFNPEDRKIDCHSCGYDSCKEMVRAIANGYNFKRNCVHYVKEENQRLYLADTLSGIPNTNAFLKRCNGIISSGEASNYFTIYFNIRNMKYINRKYGSKTGDSILADYARKVNKLAKEDELVARWGGDVFIALFRKDRMKEVLDALDNVTVSVCRQEGNEDCHIGYRAAIYELTGEENSAGQVMGQVTTTFASLKRSNKQIIYFTKELGEKILHNTVIEEMLEPALKNNEFVVYYQPKVSMDNKQLAGAEALVRWQHDGKIIPPLEFIPISEDNGFVQKIDFYVLEKVCKDMKEWLDKGLNLVKVSFNFSKQHFAERDVADRIDAMIEKYGIPKEYMEVEFTETAYLEGYDNLVSTIETLTEHNISASIDDFGTGYSSLSLLQNVKFHTLKLDKSFLSKKAGDERCEAVISNIIRMAKQLHMNIVAEGIETPEEFNYLKNLSCDMAQGYLFDKPLTKEAFENRLLDKDYAKELVE